MNVFGAARGDTGTAEDIVTPTLASEMESLGLEATVTGMVVWLVVAVGSFLIWDVNAARMYERWSILRTRVSRVTYRSKKAHEHSNRLIKWAKKQHEHSNRLKNGQRTDLSSEVRHKTVVMNESIDAEHRPRGLIRFEILRSSEHLNWAAR